MNFLKNVPLRQHTTFFIGGPAEHFCRVSNAEEVREAVAFARGKSLPVFVLGGGSNVLVSDRGFSGLVIQPVCLGTAVVQQDEDSIWLKISSGEQWDRLVSMTVQNGWWGIENLSHIPGLCGGFAVQNVGAYGQEASQVVVEVEACSMVSGEVKIFRNSDCDFSYRKSIFNSSEKNRYIILSTTIALSKTPRPNLSYGDVSAYFAERGIQNPTQQNIRQAIIEIRDKKFPFPDRPQNGNAGSFFRGPVISEEHMEMITKKVSEQFGAKSADRLLQMKNRLSVPQGYKTPTAFLLELLGLKGFQIGGAKINPQQPAIVLNATGMASATDVLQLRDHVALQVKENFGISLEVEPECVGF